MFFRKKKLSEVAETYIHSMTNCPEDWKLWEFEMGGRKSLTDPKLWTYKDGKALIYCSENQERYMTINKTQFENLRGFVVLEPHEIRFNTYENPILVEAFGNMIKRKAALAVSEGAPVLTYSELKLITEELIRNNATYSLTSPNERIREWAKQLLKDRKSE